MNFDDFLAGLFGTLVTAGATPAPGPSIPLPTLDVKTWLAIGGFALSAFLGYLTFRKNKNEEVTGSQDVKMRLDALIDTRVEKQLVGAYKKIDELEKSNTELEKKVARLEGVGEENTQIKAFVHRYLTTLLRWDHGGRMGKIPMPNESDVAVIGLEHPVEDTLTRQQRQAAQERTGVD